MIPKAEQAKGGQNRGGKSIVAVRVVVSLILDISMY